jgi:ParB family transcriptional regulator, chromosome partitioning protein
MYEPSHGAAMSEHKRTALGKGLSALIPDAPEPTPGVTEVDIDLLQPNAYQPRMHLDEARLEELVRSIKGNGVIQPIVVHRTTDGGYRIIAGERRWRAAQRAGLHRVPVVVREVGAGDEKKLLEMALVENVQREDLNPIEEGHAYRRLADEFSLTQDAIATTVGKDRSTVANMLRLLRLPEEIQHEVATGRLSAGHARALLSLSDEAQQRRVGREVVARSLSVRDTEGLVKKASEPRTEAAATATPADVHTRAAEEKLRLHLGTRVRIVRRGGRGRIEIDFSSEEELIRLFDALTTS